jgi:HSP20 family protein
MALIRWLDRDEFAKRWQETQRNWMNNPWWNPAETANTGSPYPPINIYDDGESFVVRAELPGVKPEMLDITVTGDTLTLRGAREIDPVAESCCYHRQERSAGEFRRAFTLPEQVDSNKVVARHNNGVLEIMLPRAEQAKAKKIRIEKN